MAVELKIPEVGESIVEGQITKWLKREGERVEKDEPVVEIDTDKVSVEVPAPASGILEGIEAKEGETVKVGQVVARINESGDGAKKRDGKRETKPEKAQKDQTPEKEEPQEKPHEAAVAVEEETEKEEAAPAPKVEVRPRSTPTARRAEPQREEPPREEKPREPQAAPPRRPTGDRQEERQRMTPLRRRIAQRLVEAQQTAALLTTFNEIDMTAVKQFRADYGETFRKRHGVKLGFMSFFVRAAIDALKRFDRVNAIIEGEEIVYRRYYDIGVAVGTEQGLVVPVLRDADGMSFAEIEQAIDDLARRARDRKLDLDEITGGTFTITNGGIYGSLLSTPIVNPPQSGILGLHAIQDRPVAVTNDVKSPAGRGAGTESAASSPQPQIVIRPMMYVALTYDHRIIDGQEAVLFLRHIKEMIEAPARLLLGV